MADPDPRYRRGDRWGRRRWGGGRWGRRYRDDWW